jgi:hypothetical protein
MVSFESASCAIATLTYFLDELSASDSNESIICFISRKLPNVDKSVKSAFNHVEKELFIFDAAFRCKTNVEFQQLVQRDYILLSRYYLIRFFGNEKIMYCNLSSFSARETFPAFNDYLTFVKGENPMLDIGINKHSLIRWCLRLLRGLPLTNVEKQIVCYELKQLSSFFNLELSDDKLFDILGISQLDVTEKNYQDLLENVCDFGFSLWKSYFKQKPNLFFQYGGNQ